MRKSLVVVAAAAFALAALAATASASQTFAASIYGNTTYTCKAGSTDTSGGKYGVFRATEVHNNQLVQAMVYVDNLYPNRLYSITVTEYGTSGRQSCVDSGTIVYFTTSSRGNATVYFTFWAHTYKTSAWVTVWHNSRDAYRSTALPINR